jgi:xylulokinase
MEPGLVWERVCATVEEALEACRPEQVAAVGIAGMAETGLLLDRNSGMARTPFYPWFDPGAAPQAERLAAADDPAGRFIKTGIRMSFKASLAKVLALAEWKPQLIEGGVWLGAAEWVAYRLCGQRRTEYSLAGRTGAFDIGLKRWDTAWLEELGLPPDIFSPAAPALEPVGETAGPEQHGIRRLRAGLPLFIAGHDHVAASFAAGAVRAGEAFDSMGTAEALLGSLEADGLDEAAYRSGLSYGCFCLPGRLYWMGGLSASGGSIEWLRRLLGENVAGDITYSRIEGLLESCSPGPGSILYFPYLSGSGSPHTDPAVRAAFLGLDASHTQADLFKAVLEGTAYELEYIRRAGEAVAGRPIHRLAIAGGGARSPAWLQIKADVSGTVLEALHMPEATLLGAALIAGLGSGLYADEAEALRAIGGQPRRVIRPRPELHQEYRRRFEEGFLALQPLLRQYR